MARPTHAERFQTGMMMSNTGSQAHLRYRPSFISAIRLKPDHEFSDSCNHHQQCQVADNTAQREEQLMDLIISYKSATHDHDLDDALLECLREKEY